jgi:hypothetical protein
MSNSRSVVKRHMHLMYRLLDFSGTRCVGEVVSVYYWNVSELFLEDEWLMNLRLQPFSFSSCSAWESSDGRAAPGRESHPAELGVRARQSKPFVCLLWKARCGSSG